MEYYKIINTTIVGFLSTLIVFNWRNGMGVGAFLSAQYLDKCRQYLILYRSEYKFFNDAIESEKWEIHNRYNRDVRLHFIFALLTLTTLILFLYNSGVIEEKKTVYLFEAILTMNGLSVTILTLVFLIVPFAVFFSHTKVSTLGLIDRANRELQNAIDAENSAIEAKNALKERDKLERKYDK